MAGETGAGRTRRPLTSWRLTQGMRDFLELGAGEFKARAELPRSTRGAGGTNPLWLFCSTGSAMNTAMPQGTADAAGLQSATAVLRSGAGGVGVVGMAALPRLRWLRGQPPVGGWGEAPASLARLRGHWSILSGSGGLNS